MADNIQVVGDIFHALASHIGLSEQSCVSEFPAQVSLARQVLRDAADGSIMATRMLADVADATAGIKSLVRSLALPASSAFTTVYFASATGRLQLACHLMCFMPLTNTRCCSGFEFP